MRDMDFDMSLLTDITFTQAGSPDYIVLMGYLHYNPVKHDDVGQVEDLPYSTFHQLVKRLIYPEGRGLTWLNLRLVKVFKTCGVLRCTNTPYRAVGYFVYR